MSLFGTMQYWLQQVPKIAPRNIFDRFSGFIYLVCYTPNFFFYWPKLLFQSIHMNSASCAWLTRSLRDKCLYLERSSIGCKMFQRVNPEPFLEGFQFPFCTQFITGQTFSFTGQTFYPNRFV